MAREKCMVPASSARQTAFFFARRMGRFFAACLLSGFYFSAAWAQQPVDVALVVGSETVVIEQFGQLHKLLVLIRAQAMFFDFKSMNVVRAYPLSFAYVDALDHAPSEDEIRGGVRLVYEGVAEKPGVLARFVDSAAKASIPS